MFDPLCFKCDECSCKTHTLTDDNRIVCVSCKKDWVPSTAPMDQHAIDNLKLIENFLNQASRLAEFDARLRINDAMMRLDLKYGGKVSRLALLEALRKAVDLKLES